ncbi:hypothetical protein BDV26DRAFT_303111 [Aspergillus bertholletiae]|uniref:Uncharacterized protein n=1 Tax=Aspergillus bertholletiae TaxID=1226010 RepID=A0A5N7AQG7_9EURO|nr:hypothetical protein BDV26DRAFT_303111 [Aspergillus bertholletiae]
MPTKLPLTQVIASLSALPRELAHQILNDIRIWDILRLLCYNNANINTDILTHPTLGRLFSHSTDILDEVRTTVTLYRTVCAEHSLTVAPLTSPLAFNAHTGPLDYKEITNYMHHLLVDQLYLPPWKRDVLAHYAPLPFDGDATSTVPALASRWAAIHAAQDKLNARKAAQIRRVAALLEAHPDVLKRTPDPRQTPSKNVSHSVRWLRHVADRMLHQSLLRGDMKRGMSLFAYGYLPVMPFDRTLGVVLRGLARVGVEAGVDRVVDAERWARETQGLGEEVGGLVRVVVEGLWFVYDGGKSEERVPRIGVGQGGFWYFIPHDPTEAKENALHGLAQQYDVHDEREITWLEAFVAMYRHFEAPRA